MTPRTLLSLVVSFACLTSLSAQENQPQIITVEVPPSGNIMARVGQPENAPDEQGQGKVDYEFNIGLFPITVQDWTDMLNKVGSIVDPVLRKADPHHLWNPNMIPWIRRSGVAVAGFSYQAVEGKEKLPISFVNIFDCARYCNIQQNLSKLKNLSLLVGRLDDISETGAYDITVDAHGNDISISDRLPGAQFFIPIKDEWMKAAYYKRYKLVINKRKEGEWAECLDAGYFMYSTRSNANPYGEENIEPNNTNNNIANYTLRFRSRLYPYRTITDVDACGRMEVDIPNKTLTMKGTYSPYGCIDMGGNLNEWTLTPFSPNKRSSINYRYYMEHRRGIEYIVRGGCYESEYHPLLNADNDLKRVHNSPEPHFSLDTRSATIGFRMGSIADIPAWNIPTTSNLPENGLTTGEEMYSIVDRVQTVVAVVGVVGAAICPEVIGPVFAYFAYDAAADTAEESVGCFGWLQKTLCPRRISSMTDKGGVTLREVTNSPSEGLSPSAPPDPVAAPAADPAADPVPQTPSAPPAPAPVVDPTSPSEVNSVGRKLEPDLNHEGLVNESEVDSGFDSPRERPVSNTDGSPNISKLPSASPKQVSSLLENKGESKEIPQVSAPRNKEDIKQISRDLTSRYRGQNEQQVDILVKSQITRRRSTGSLEKHDYIPSPSGDAILTQEKAVPPSFDRVSPATESLNSPCNTPTTGRIARSQSLGSFSSRNIMSKVPKNPESGTPSNSSFVTPTRTSNYSDVTQRSQLNRPTDLRKAFEGQFDSDSSKNAPRVSSRAGLRRSSSDEYSVKVINPLAVQRPRAQSPTLSQRAQDPHVFSPESTPVDHIYQETGDKFSVSEEDFNKSLSKQSNKNAENSGQMPGPEGVIPDTTAPSNVISLVKKFEKTTGKNNDSQANLRLGTSKAQNPLTSRLSHPKPSAKTPGNAASAPPTAQQTQTIEFDPAEPEETVLHIHNSLSSSASEAQQLENRELTPKPRGVDSSKTDSRATTEQLSSDTAPLRTKPPVMKLTKGEENSVPPVATQGKSRGSSSSSLGDVPNQTQPDTLTQSPGKKVTERITPVPPDAPRLAQSEAKGVTLKKTPHKRQGSDGVGGGGRGSSKPPNSTSLKKQNPVLKPTKEVTMNHEDVTEEPSASTTVITPGETKRAAVVAKNADPAPGGGGAVSGVSGRDLDRMIDRRLPSAARGSRDSRGLIGRGLIGRGLSSVGKFTPEKTPPK